MHASLPVCSPCPCAPHAHIDRTCAPRAHIMYLHAHIAHVPPMKTALPPSCDVSHFASLLPPTANPSCTPQARHTLEASTPRSPQVTRKTHAFHTTTALWQQASPKHNPRPLQKINNMAVRQEAHPTAQHGRQATKAHPTYTTRPSGNKHTLWSPHKARSLQPMQPSQNKHTPQPTHKR